MKPVEIDARQLFVSTRGKTERLLSEEALCRSDSTVTGDPVILSDWAARCHFLAGGAWQNIGLILPGDLAFLGSETGAARREEIATPHYASSPAFTCGRPTRYSSF